MTSRIPLHAVVHRSPNYRRIDTEVFFDVANGHRAETPVLRLTPDDAALFDAVDGRATFAELKGGHPSAATTLPRWYRAGIIEHSPAAAPEVDPMAPHIVVIEPHFDDMALSVGGSLLSRRNQSRITVVTVATRSWYTRFSEKPGFDTEKVSRTRLAEGSIACAMLGAEHVVLDAVDYCIREERGDTTFPLWHQVLEMAEALSPILRARRPSEVWLPLGIGFHCDHLLVRDAAVQAIATHAADLAGTRVKFYEDMPYAAGWPLMVRRVLARKSFGPSSRRVVLDVTDQMDEKIRLVHVYGSQFEPEWIEKVLRRAAASNAREGRVGEAFWEPPAPLRPIRPGYLEFGDVAGWFESAKSAEHVDVVLLGEGARPADLRLLARLLPKVRIRVAMASNHSLAAADGLPDGLEVVCFEPSRWRTFGAVARHWLAHTKPGRHLIFDSPLLAVAPMRAAFRAFFPSRQALSTAALPSLVTALELLASGH